MAVCTEAFFSALHGISVGVFLNNGIVCVEQENVIACHVPVTLGLGLVIIIKAAHEINVVGSEVNYRGNLGTELININKLEV